MEIKFWKDKQTGRIDPLIMSQHADEFAKSLKEARFKEDRKTNRRHEDKNINKVTQIRRFYDEVVRLDTLAKVEKTDMQWYAVLPQVHMLAAKAAYAKGRKLVSENFNSFIVSCVNQVHDRDDLSVFAKLFEAVIGFFTLYDNEKTREQA